MLASMAFQCSVCGADFEIPQAALDKYPGWKPKYCREHSPRKKSSGRSFKQEENLTLAQVLAKYSDGPDSGVFTDGSASPNPGPGGWGTVWVEAGEVREQRHGKEAHTTNNRMELKALVEAYKLLPGDAQAAVHSDSRLCVDSITKWAPNWERKGWTKKGGPIKNLELIQELYELFHAHENCPLIWIAAHSGNRWNEYADSLATAWQRDEL